MSTDRGLPDVHFEFDNCARAPRRARAAMRGLVPAATDPLLEDRAVLVVSELVTNVVRHTAHGGTLTAWKRSSPALRLRVEVADHERAAPVRQEASDAGGRGISIVDQSCDSWGVTLHADGKVVWAELCPTHVLPDRPKPGESTVRSPG